MDITKSKSTSVQLSVKILLDHYDCEIILRFTYNRLQLAHIMLGIIPVWNVINKA